MDEDEVDDDDDVDMEFGDEISEHTSDTEEEDGGDEDEDLENESGSEEEVWRDVDEEDEDLVENEDEPVVDGDDDGDEDGDENPGWEVSDVLRYHNLNTKCLRRVLRSVKFLLISLIARKMKMRLRVNIIHSTVLMKFNSSNLGDIPIYQEADEDDEDDIGSDEE